MFNENDVINVHQTVFNSCKLDSRDAATVFNVFRMLNAESKWSAGSTKGCQPENKNLKFLGVPGLKQFLDKRANQNCFRAANETRKPLCRCFFFIFNFWKFRDTDNFF